MPEDVVETLLLPLSGLRLRSDGTWRCVVQAQYDDEEAGLCEADPDEWTPVDLPVGNGGRAQWAPGPRDEASWWLVYGDNRSGRMTVTLADGRTPPIYTFGPLWICEWVSRWQEAVVTIGGESHKVFARIPHYLRIGDLGG